ncbi:MULTISPECIES: VENN motif pre-toxin domain-containing protein [Lelliottia]|uniref:VENN motif pre-toxin domain-containing protein n=1 Tax=Lelliottia wanjuensis TaxID=3050585 RepID=A0AAP4FVC3_9ENTR|nr:MULTISPECIES: VENN motif pre-toxin domain-containing protein [unclassified Lelliottia]MDK9362269.1 VENN motif pre-toxin domain-containing protein [Lelliottia sp. V106_12]MDK9586568.1 VENN motif pre-toxin domain-containing protein [Lelliottia sp. V86_10]MDK9618076.1 VENN motif pre-toxin domain-containing protein [Lelliottia sp. V106_9]
MVGWRKDEYSSNTESNQQSTLRSDITSQKGNVSLQAGNDVSVHGAGISAGKSLVVSGNNVLFDVSEDSLKSHSESSSTQYGLQGQVSGWAASAAQNIERTARSAQDDRDPRLTGIYATQAGLDAATQTMQGNMDPSAFKVSVTATGGTSSQEQDQSSRQQQGTPCTPGTPSSSKDVKDLDANQRTFISNLATAGGSVGGDTFSASSGANAARVEVENNYLSNTDITAFTEKYAAAKTDAEKEQLLA